MATSAPDVDRYGQPVGRSLSGWTPPPAPARAPMVGRACRLEPLDGDSHASALFRAYHEAADGRDWTYLAIDRPDTPEAWRVEVDRRAASADPLHFAIVVDGEPLGTAAFMRIDPANGVIEIGHVAYAPRLQRTRAGTEAIVLMMARAFALGYRRLEWKCDSLNAPSRRAALRYGFGFEGIFRNAIVTKGRNRDTAWFAMTDSDWPAIQPALDGWLDPANHDDLGRQRRPLAALRGG